MAPVIVTNADGNALVFETCKKPETIVAGFQRV
jgi:hypothetical protein